MSLRFFAANLTHLLRLVFLLAVASGGVCLDVPLSADPLDLKELTKLPLESPANSIKKVLDSRVPCIREDSASDQENRLLGKADGTPCDGNVPTPTYGAQIADVVVFALDLAVARQLACLRKGDVADDWTLPNSAGTLTPEQLSKERHQILRQVEKKETRLVVDFDTPAANHHDETHNIISLTKQFFEFEWPDPDSGLPTEEQLTDGAERGWDALQRVVVHELAHAALPGHGHDVEWQNMELFLWEVWERCSVDKLADFGDAPVEEYPTRLFSGVGFTPIHDVSPVVVELRTGRKLLDLEDRSGVIGAHHLDTNFEWLGDGVTLEGDTKAPGQDENDDGVFFAGAPLTNKGLEATLELVISVKDSAAERYGQTGRLLFCAWVDWDNDGSWTDLLNRIEWKRVEKRDGPNWVEADEEDGVERRRKDLVFHPEKWQPSDSESFRVTLRKPKEVETGGWARFRLYYRTRNESLSCHPGGQARFGEVEDYKLEQDGTLSFRRSPEKSASPSLVPPKGYTVFTLRLPALAGEKGASASMVDPLPDSVVFRGDLFCDSGNCKYEPEDHTVLWNGSLGEGGTVTVRFRVQTDEEIAPDEMICNTAVGVLGAEEMLFGTCVAVVPSDIPTLSNWLLALFGLLLLGLSVRWIRLAI